MPKKAELARGGQVTINMMGTPALVARALAVQEWIDRTGNLAPSHGGKASMSHVYRLLLERGLTQVEKEIK